MSRYKCEGLKNLRTSIFKTDLPLHGMQFNWNLFTVKDVLFGKRRVFKLSNDERCVTCDKKNEEIQSK